MEEEEGEGEGEEWERREAVVVVGFLYEFLISVSQFILSVHFFSSHLNLISWFDCIPSLLDYRHSVHHWRGKRESKA